MALSNSPLSYEDCIQVLQAALDDPAGARIRFEDQKSATHFRMRCHQARVIDRRQNAESYPKESPLHNASAYDRLTIREPRRIEGEWWLYIEQTAVIPGKIESLSTGEKLELSLQTLPTKPPAAPPSEDDMLDAFNDMKVEEEEIFPGQPKGFRR